MSSTSSIETPTTPTAQHTTTAIVVSQQQKQQSLIAKRSHSVSSSASSASSVSFGAAGSANSSSVSERDKSRNAAFPPATIAAVHHQQQQQQQQRHSYALLQKQPSLRHSVQPQLTQPTSSSLASSLSASTGSASTAHPAAAPSESTATSSSLCCADIKANVNSLTTQKMHRPIPSDKINLRLILVTGKTKEFLFNPSDSAGDIAQTVFDNWPEDWAREAVSKAEILRLIYQGRFLHCNVTLGALGLPLGKTTVMHLVPRDNLPEPNSQDQRQKSKGGSGRCCSTTCCIL